MFTICTIAFVAITIIDGLFRKGTFDGDKLPSEEEYQRTIYEMGRATESRTVRVEIDRVFQEEHDRKLDMFKFQEHDAIEKRDAYRELKEKRDAIFVDYDALETEKKSIDRAISLINKISDELGSQFQDITARISDMLNLLSGGAYQEIKLDDMMHVSVRKDDHFFRIEFLGKEVVNQVYLAVRLAVASIMNKEKMPLVIDDAINLKEGMQSEDILKAISKTGAEQTIILTSDENMVQKLTDANIMCNIVRL